MLDVRLMGLMARVARDSSRMIGCYDLRKSFRLGAVGFVTTGTEYRRVEFGGSDRCRILGMPGKGSVAGLTRNHHVLAQLLLVDDLGVAALARLVAGESNGTSRDLGDGIAAIVAVLSEAVGDHSRAQDDESDHRDHHDYRETNEVFYVLEQVDLPAPGLRARLRAKSAMSLDT